MDGPPVTTQGEAQSEALVNELKWVHRLIRRDLQIVRQLAADVSGGLAGDAAAEAIRSLEVSGPLWQLKVNCLQYCRFVHGHHHLESAMLFPALRRANPALGPVVDKLEADHAAVATLLDQVSAAADELTGPGEPAARGRLVAGLRELSDVLLAHLAYEEDNVSATLAAMTSWPAW
jgi:hypothetical protein